MKKKCTIRSHADLRHRDADRDVTDLPESLQAVYQDAIKRGCGCAPVSRLSRVKGDEPKAKDEGAD